MNKIEHNSMKRKDDFLIYAMIVMFLFAVFGHNLNQNEPRRMYYSDGEEKEMAVIEENSMRVVTVTQYHPAKEQCDDDPLVTADNSVIDLEELEQGNIKWVAISRDLREVYDYGDVIVLSGDPEIAGTYIVHDTMHPRFTNRIDILTSPGQPTGKWEQIIAEKKRV